MNDDTDARIKALINKADERINGTPSATGGASTITINAGGLGVWISVTCCAVMLACNLFLIALYVDQQQQIRDMSDYLAAIYAQAPHLKPENKP